MTTEAKNARIYGSVSDAILLAPVGTTMPTTIAAAPAAAFEDVGWLSDAGITETFTGTASEIRGHQGQGVVRKRMETPGTKFGFVALETKKQTSELRYYVKSSTTTSGTVKQTRGAGQRVSRRAAIIDLFDADDLSVRTRLLIPVLEITPNGDRTYVATDIAGFAFEGEIIGDYEVLEIDTWTPSGP